MFSSLLPTCPVIAVTNNEKTYRQMSIVADVIPMYIDQKGTPQEVIPKGIDKAMELGIIQKGDILAISGGEKVLDGRDAKMNRTIGGVITA